MPITAEYIADEVARGQQYFLVLLLRGSRERNDSELLEDLQQRHLKHMFGLRRQGKLVLNGPTLVDAELRGILIFNLSSEQELWRHINADPMVEAGFLKAKVYPWMGLPGDSLP